MHHLHTLDDDAAVLTTRERQSRPTRDRRQDQSGQARYAVSLTDDDLRLIQACSAWISQLGPAPDIRARLVHLEQQLACAQPAPTTPHPAAWPSSRGGAGPCLQAGG